MFNLQPLFVDAFYNTILSDFAKNPPAFYYENIADFSC